MSGFGNVGANAFLSSPFLEKHIGPNPQTARGVGTQVYAHPKEPRIIYPSGKFIVVKNVENPSDCFVYRGHNHATTVAKFSPNGFWVASADVSGQVRVWAWDNPEHLTKLETVPFAGEVKDLDWDGESKKIVAVGEGNPLFAKVFTWDTGNSAGELVGHNKRATTCAFKAQRPFRIMTGSEDMRTIYYNGPPFKYDHSNAVHTNFVNAVRFSPNGEYAVSVGSDKKIQFYAGKTGEPTFESANAHAGSIYSVSVSLDSTRMITSSADKTVKLWEVTADSSTCVQTFVPCEGNTEVGDMQVAAVYSGPHMISLSLNGNLNYFSPESTLPVRVVQGHQTAISCVTVNRETGLIYTGSTDGVICCTDSSNGFSIRLSGPSSVKSVSGSVHAGKAIGLAVCDNQKLLSIGWDDKLRSADLASHVYSTESGCAGQPSAIASSAGLTVVTSGNDISLFVNLGADRIGGLSGLSYQPTCVALVANGSEVAVGGNDSKTRVYAIADGVLTEIKVIETRSPVTAVAYHPASGVLAIGDSGRQIEVYERGSWNAIIQGKWVFHTSQITSLAWSPDGRYLASGSVDSHIFIWDFSNYQSKLQITFTHIGGVLGLDWLADDRFVSVGNDGCFNFWKFKPSDVK